jgi:hypothetical protein
MTAQLASNSALASSKLAILCFLNMAFLLLRISAKAWPRRDHNISVHQCQWVSLRIAFCILYFFASYLHHMKYTLWGINYGERRVMSVKDICFASYPHFAFLVRHCKGADTNLRRSRALKNYISKRSGVGILASEPTVCRRPQHGESFLSPPSFAEKESGKRNLCKKKCGTYPNPLIR